MFQKLALSFLKPTIIAWLQNRALVIPAAEQQTLATAIGKATGNRVSAADALIAIQMVQSELQNLAVVGVSSIL